MDPSSAQHHHQEMSSQTLESMLVCTKAQQEKKPRPPAEQALKCPRCDSTNTKFCYYNNYSLTQPRYFCKSCRRYWTKGGTLRNVPVGGGCRKKRSSSSSSSASSKRSSHDQPLSNNSVALPSLTPLSHDHHHSSDLSLAIARLQKQASAKMGFDNEHQNHEFSILGSHNNNHHLLDHGLGNPSVDSSSASHGLFDALRHGFLETPNGFHNFYNYCANVGNGNMGGHVENGTGELGIRVSEEMATMPYEDQLNGATTASTVVKQEMMCSNVRENHENRVLWGFPWQNGGDVNMADLDSGRQSWNGFGSTWHGLLNGPLM